MATVVVDTGVWIAMCDARDAIVPAQVIATIRKQVQPHTVVLPWPVAYETLRTRFVRNDRALRMFESEMRAPNVAIVDDAPHRDDAYALTMASSLVRGRPMSMVDCLLRLMLADRTMRIRYFVSFNERDFADICRSRRIELWPGGAT